MRLEFRVSQLDGIDNVTLTETTGHDTSSQTPPVPFKSPGGRTAKQIGQFFWLHCGRRPSALARFFRVWATDSFQFWMSAVATLQSWIAGQLLEGVRHSLVIDWLGRQAFKRVVGLLQLLMCIHEDDGDV